MEEQASLPFHNKDVLPPQKLDRGLFMIMTLGIPFAVLWLWLVVLPHYHTWPWPPVVLVHLVSTCFILHNVVGNIYMLKRIDATGKQRGLPAVLQPGWNYCPQCQLNAPPRSYHCPNCNECVLKRDHHCKFAGCCVGYHNQRYFILAVLYMWIGAVYGVYYEWDYVFQQLDGFRLASVLSLAAPHVAWVLGVTSSYGFLVSILHVIGMLVLITTSYLLVLQLAAIYQGQTQHERKHNITSYNLGWKRNFRDIFGTGWFLTWVSPWVRSQLPGDGIKFLMPEEIEEVKNI